MEACLRILTIDTSGLPPYQKRAISLGLSKVDG